MVRFVAKNKQANINPYVNLGFMGSYMLKDLII